jgi:excisionase family DNA binding protein
MMEKPIAIKEAAACLGMTWHRLYQLVSEGRVPHIRPTGPRGRILFYESALKNYIRKNTVNNISDLNKMVANQ